MLVPCVCEVLLENVEEVLDPSLEPVLTKAIVKKGGQMILRLGSEDVPSRPRRPKPATCAYTPPARSLCASPYSARMIKAYNKALGIKSKSDRQKHRLLEVLATRNNSIERPATAPGGASWSEWYFEIVQ